MSDLKFYGVIQNGKDEYNKCGEASNDCQVSPLIKEEFDKECMGKNECAIDLSKYVESCYDKYNKIYISYQCDIEDQIETNNAVRMYVSFTGVIFSFFYVACIYYLKKSAHLNFKLWDNNTVTPADWTVMIRIPKDVWVAWQNQCYMIYQFYKNQGRSDFQDLVPIEDFKKYFQDEIL